MSVHNAADNSFKLIFDDHRLFADFLRDFVHVDILKDVRPEDIEDMRERFVPLFQEQRDADTVKKVSLKGGEPFFVIAILEHQSQVNFRTCFKMLLYISLVLTEWEKEAEKQKPDSSLAKDFKYPPVLPIVLYDGRGVWTAQRNFFERTHLNTAFEKYIPKFEYEVINLNEYSEAEIMRFGGALSFILLVDKMRNSREKFQTNRLPEDYVEKLRLQIPEDMHKLLVDITLSFLDKGGHDRDEAEATASIVEKAKKKEYGGMFEAAIESLREEREEAFQEGIMIGKDKFREEIREEVLKEGLEDVARNVLTKGYSFEEIHDLTGLEMETLRKLLPR